MLAEKKSLLSKLIKNMLTRKKHQMVTYIIGEAYDKKDVSFFQRTIKTSLQPIKTLPPPPQMSNGASLMSIPAL